MNKRTVGIILVILAVIAAGMVLKKTFFDKSEKAQEEFTAEEQQEQDHGTDEEGETAEEGESTSQENETKSAEGFDDLHSVVEYDVPDGFEEYVEPVSFDEAMVDYLLEEKLIGQGAHEVLTEHLYLLKCDGLITIDVESKMSIFYMQLSNKDRTLILCSIDKWGNYKFDHH